MEGVFHPLEVFKGLITSEAEDSFTGNFVTFPNIKCRIRLKLKIFKICNLGHVTIPYLVSGHGKTSQNLTITFNTMAQIQ